MTTKEVAVREERGVVPHEDMLGLSGEFNEADLVIPTVQLVQPTSASERGTAGKFCFQDGRELDEMNVVVLNIIATRGILNPDRSSDEMFLCKSNDSRMGMTRYAATIMGDLAPKGTKNGEVQYIVCKECPHYEDIKDRRLSDGDCKRGYTLLCYEQESASPFLFYVKGTAVTPIKKSIVGPALLRYQQGLDVDPWKAPYLWSIRLNETEKGKWYTPVIKPGVPFEPSERDEFARLASEYTGTATAQLAKEEEELAAAEPEQAAFDAE